MQPILRNIWTIRNAELYFVCVCILAIICTALILTGIAAFVRKENILTAISLALILLNIAALNKIQQEKSDNKITSWPKHKT